jgi:hypothetical protein
MKWLPLNPSPSLASFLSDIYVFCCSYSHNVAPRDKWIAFVSTTVETSDPAGELAPGLQLLGRIDDRFVEVVDVFEPLGDGSEDAAFISKGYDATSHFESEIADVLDMYRRITGTPAPACRTACGAAVCAAALTSVQNMVDGSLHWFRALCGLVCVQPFQAFSPRSAAPSRTRPHPPLQASRWIWTRRICASGRRRSERVRTRAPPPPRPLAAATCLPQAGPS